MVLGGICLVVILQKMGLFPACSTKKLFMYGCILASAGIVYNYRTEITYLGKELELFELLGHTKKTFKAPMGTDISMLAQKPKSNLAQQENDASRSHLTDLVKKAMNILNAA